MKCILSYITFTLLSLTALPGWAVNIYECEDEQGNRTFERRCPPGTTPINQKSYKTKAPGGGGTQKTNLNATLYVVPDCDTCDQVREFLSIRNISFTEKDVNDNVELQEELKDKTGGDLRVPVLVLGDKVLSGYNRTSLLNALADAGYTE